MTARFIWLIVVLFAGCTKLSGDTERFEYRDAQENTVLTLNGNGEAMYTQQVKRPDGTTTTFEADSASWKRCNLDGNSAPSHVEDGHCIAVEVLGKDEQGAAKVRLQFARYPDRLVEYTESGPGRQLSKFTPPSQ